MGGSVLLYREPELFKKHCFVKEDWTGGIYGTSNLSGSRSGSVIGLTWAYDVSRYGGISKRSFKNTEINL